jgi:ABC-type antimicrobial peptide transport system permease subunit
VRYLIRDADEPGSAGEPASPWYEIVGVVGDLGIVTGDGEPGQDAGLYHPVAAGAVHPMHVAVHVRGDPESFAPTLRSIAIGVEPTLRLHDVLPLDRVGASMWLESDFLFRLVTIVSAVALLLSLTAVYSVLSFTVSRRTREIGIRIALGAEKRRILFAVFRRPLVQVGIGVLAGGGLVAALSTAVLAGLTITEAALVVAYAALMLTVCMLACIVPAWRALRVQPTEALRQD